jgi:solute carrier family 41
MLISSGTGMILDKGVAKYRGFALLAISRTGLTGSIGAIHANRLTTALHTQLARLPKTPTTPLKSPSYSNLAKIVASGKGMLLPREYGMALFVLGFPMQGLFLWFVKWAGWIDLSLGWSGWFTFGLTVSRIYNLYV